MKVTYYNKKRYHRNLIQFYKNRLLIEKVINALNKYRRLILLNCIFFSFSTSSFSRRVFSD